MKGITENNFSPNAGNISGEHALDRAIGAYWHKCGSLYRTPVEYQTSPPCQTIGRIQFKSHAVPASRREQTDLR